MSGLRPMLTIACVKQGSKYGADYVRILFDMVRRNLGRHVEGRFVSFTDDATGLDAVDGIECMPLPDDLKGWWAKMWLFSPKAFPAGERIVYLDLDTAIVGDLEWLTEYRGRFGAMSDLMYSNLRGLNSGVMAWESGALVQIWDRWNAEGRPMPDEGDQAMIERYCGSWSPLQELFPGKIVSYKSDCIARPPRNEASIVCFHGFPKPHECKDEWLRNVWRIGGWAGAEVKTYCNTATAEIEANILWAIDNIQERVFELVPHDGRAVIVGGGPSLESTMPEIARRALSGQTIFAINGAAQYLNDHGIRPHYQVILDARKENARFLDFDPADSYLIASQCHKDIFNRVPKRFVRRWHSLTLGMREFLKEKEPDCLLIGGGTTALTRTMNLVHAMGYRMQHLYGVDSSYKNDRHHAYAQTDDATAVWAYIGDKSFRAAAWMVAQANDFMVVSQILAEHDTTITIHGDGLLPAVARAMMLEAAPIQGAA